MIRRLVIRDLALMDRAELELGAGFTVVTGETGAGKSVLLGALSLLAGHRAAKTVVRKGAEECVVEADRRGPALRCVAAGTRPAGLR
jgi:DNA repair protein RecN (Recombination protein N)